MIAHAHEITSQTHQDSATACWHPDFLTMLPDIERHARIAFRHVKGDNREEAVQEAVCNACQAFARLVERGREQAATWSSLAKYAVAQVRDGRRIGSPLNVRDVCSTHCQTPLAVHFVASGQTHGVFSLIIGNSKPRHR